jgi:hypothetical protein
MSLVSLDGLIKDRNCDFFVGNKTSPPLYYNAGDIVIYNKCFRVE